MCDHLKNALKSCKSRTQENLIKIYLGNWLGIFGGFLGIFAGIFGGNFLGFMAEIFVGDFWRVWGFLAEKGKNGSKLQHRCFDIEYLGIDILRKNNILKFRFMHEELLTIISEVSGISKKDITGKARSRSFMIPRQLLCYYLRKKYKYKLIDIADLFNGHHSTVMHSVKQIETMIFIRDHETLSLISLVDAKIKESIIDLPKKVIITIPNNLDYMVIFAIISKQFNNCKVEISF